MSPKKMYSGSSIVIGVALTTLASMSSLVARAELVLEPAAAGTVEPQIQNTSLPSAQPTSMRAEDREVVRQVMQSAERAANTINQNPYTSQGTAIQAQPGGSVTQNSQPIVVAPVSIASSQQSSQVEVENLSKTELMRRERTRVELRNEDRLQERLEELRLRDERKREAELTGGAYLGAGTTAQASATAISTPSIPVQTESVTAVATVQGAPAAGVQVQPVLTPIPPATMTDTVSSSSASPLSSATALDASVSSSERVQFVVTPRGGIGNVISTVAYDVRPRFAVGGNLGVGIGQHFQLEAGYTYSEMGVAVNLSNPYIAQYNQWAMNTGMAPASPGSMSPYGYPGTYGGSPYYAYAYQPSAYGYGATMGSSPTLGNESVVLKQNVIDLGTKIHVLGTDYRLRPYGAIGGSYAKSFVNYDSRILSLLNRSGMNAYSSDYDISQFLGYLGLGLDVKITKAIAITAGAKYYKVLSARETGTSPYWGFSDVDKQLVGGSLARADFYQINGGLTFSF